MDTQTFIDDLMARLDGAYSPNTLRSYRTHFLQYVTWCGSRGVEPLPVEPEVVADYIADMTGYYKSATIRHRVDALGAVSYLSGFDNPLRDPVVKIALKRMYRLLGRAQSQAYPLTRDHLDKMIKKCPKTTTMGIRNRLLLLMGYETMRRRSELVAFNFEDLRLLPNGRYALFLRRSKTDQLGDGRVITISDDLAALIKRWSKRIGETRGPILRSVNKGDRVGKGALSVGNVPVILTDLQYRARLRHLPDFSGHSFRVGAAVDMLKEGVPLAEIMLRGGWTSESTALRYLKSWASTENPLDKLAYAHVPGETVL